MASKTFGRLLLKTFGVLAFCTVSAYALFLAYGYNVDLANRHIEKTSIIDVASRYPDVRVYLDDKLVGNSIPLQMKDLLPGFYDLTMSKLGYLPWSRKLEVQTDIVTKVDDVLLVPDHPDTLVQQLAHFPLQSKYYFSKDFFIVLTPDSDYLTLVYLLDNGAMKEEELKLSKQDIQDIQIFNPQQYLITFHDGSYEWVEFNGPRFIDFSLPKGSSQLQLVPEQNVSYFLSEGNLYSVPIDLLSTLTVKNLATFLLIKNVDQFDVHANRLVYVSKGMAYAADTHGKNIRLLDRSYTVSYIRYVPFTAFPGGLYVVRAVDDKRFLYSVDDRGNSTLLTPQLKDDVFQDNSGRVLFSDESGNVFIYRPLLKKKSLVTTLPPDFTLLGFLFDDGHFLYVKQQQLFLADSSYTNVYPLLDTVENTRYFLQKGAVFSLVDNKFKSFFLLPRN